MNPIINLHLLCCIVYLHSSWNISNICYITLHIEKLRFTRYRSCLRVKQWIERNSSILLISLPSMTKYALKMPFPAHHFVSQKKFPSTPKAQLDNLSSSTKQRSTTITLVCQCKSMIPTKTSKKEQKVKWNPLSAQSREKY